MDAAKSETVTRARMTALPDEHFKSIDVTRGLVRLFPEHINEHREFDGQTRQSKTDNAGSSSTFHSRRHRSALTTGNAWADVESVDDEQDVSSSDLQGFVTCQTSSHTRSQ